MWWRRGSDATRAPDGRRRRFFRPVWISAVVAVVLGAAVGVGGYRLGQPLPRPSVTLSLAAETVPGTPTPLPWPVHTEAQVDLEGIGSLGSSGPGTSVPLASITKMMTALVVLHDHPLEPGTSGPDVTVTPEDVWSYGVDVLTDQSVVRVAQGEQLSELQLLQGLLLPSANNFAQMLAVWDAGSIPAFVAKMNAEAVTLGLVGTHYVDPSGFDPGNVGTPADEIRLAEVALTEPTFASVVAEPVATLPVAGTIHNVDVVLGHDGIVGVKTGSTDAAGGCFVFAARRSVAGQPVTVVGAVLGDHAPSALPDAMVDSQRLAAAALASVRVVDVVMRGQPVGLIDAPWGSVPVVAGREAVVAGTAGMHITTSPRLDPLGARWRGGAAVGSVLVSIGATRTVVPLVAARSLPGPSLAWRLANG